MLHSIVSLKKGWPIHVEMVTKSFGNVKALQQISLYLKRGEVLGIIGPNGSGKTTLLEIISGILRPDKGKVMVFGKDPSSSPEIRKRMGVLFQETCLFDRIKVGEVISFFSSLYPKAPWAETMLTALDLDRKINCYFKNLSGGEKQKVGIILAFLSRPDIALLDEPTVNLDLPSRKQVWKVIEMSKAHGATVLISSHDLYEIGRICDRVAVMKEGMILAVESPTKIIQELNIHRIIEVDPGGDSEFDLQHPLIIDLPFTVNRQGRTFLFQSPRPVELIHGLLAIFASAKEEGWRLEVRGARLEDAYRRWMS